MNKGVAITGMGITSALGFGIESNYKALLSNKHGISFPELLDTKHKNLPVGEIKRSNLDLEEELQLSFGHSYTRAALLAIFSIKEAVTNSRLDKEQLYNMGLISGSSVGGIDATEEYYNNYESSEENRRFIRAQHPGFTTSQISGYFNINGYSSTISTACSSGANAIMMGARLIKSGKLDSVIVGGTDCLTKFTLNGFNTLKILSEELCKPFDEYRNGLNLGEGSAYLVLEADHLLNEKKVLGRIIGYGNANDAFHQTASSETGEGAFLAMKKAIQVSGLKTSEIDYINAHGTATKNNDLSESIAIERIFGSEIPTFSSTKAFTGHTLAAAGALEAVFSILSLQNDKQFANLNFTEAMLETNLKPVTNLRSVSMQHVLSNSFGFGGNCTSLIFSKNG